MPMVDIEFGTFFKFLLPPYLQGFRFGFPYPTLYPYPQSYYEQEPAYPRDTDGTKDNVMTDLVNI
jgi:hypothetical protein